MQTRAPISQPGPASAWDPLILLLLGAGVLLLSLFLPGYFNPAPTELEVTDVSQSEMTLPVYGQLLVRACEEIFSDSDSDKYECDLGLLDLEKEQLVRLAHFFWEEKHSDIAWSPDGMQFSYHNDIDLFPAESRTVVYRADGTEQYSFRSFGTGHWSADANTLVAFTCRGSNSEPSSNITVFDAVSGEPVCAVREGGGGMSCLYICSVTSCLSASECLPEEKAPEAYASDRYKATIKDNGLEVIDTRTGSVKVYVISGFTIMTIAWAPES